PAYMPPEQLAGEPADDTGDQFSYCVTVYEALFGTRPFDGPRIGELEAAIRRGPPRPADPRGVPGRVVRCLRRGLAVDKAARWPSMTALLDELDRARHRRRRGVQIAAAVALAGAAAAAILLARSDPREAVRAATESRIAVAWNPVKRVQIDAGFRAVGGALADERVDRTIRAFDAYRTAWVRQRLDAWAAVHVRGEQTVELLERRLACLDRLADTFDALTTLLSRATAAEVDRAPQMAYRLEPVATCAQIDRLMAAPAAPSSEAGARAERGLRELEALVYAGRHAEALDRAQALVAQSQQLHDPELLARARYNLGVAQQASGKSEAAEATLRLAVQDAAVARDHYLVAEAWLWLHTLFVRDLDRPAAAAQIEPSVTAAVAQAGNDPRQLADLAKMRGIAASERGDHGIARTEFLEARDRHLAALGPDHPLVAIDESNLGAALLRLGQFDEATRELERAIAIIRRSVGEHHPVIAHAEQNLSDIAAQRKDWAASEQHGRAALASVLVVRGPDHLETGTIRVYLARALREQHRYDEARGELDRARASLEHALPATHIDRIMLDLRYAQLAEAEGRWAEAERLARQTVTGMRAIAAPPIHLAFAIAELARMTAHRAPRAALALYDEALTMDTARKDRDESSDADSLAEFARVALAAGRPELALGWFDRLPAAAAKLPDLRGELERARRGR
ncbi:MAG TPA: tetratricopeptide repeat-containing protein kinase family protein, partial [Kofleriaceae bacterium]|nr:tetratricopeptide repeat-containing protein kinase family protein [Kofleriaceae bacterium]